MRELTCGCVTFEVGPALRCELHTQVLIDAWRLEACSEVDKLMGARHHVTPTVRDLSVDCASLARAFEREFVTRSMATVQSTLF